MIVNILLQNLLYKPLNALLSTLLLLLSVGIISLLMLVGEQASQKFDNDLQDIDMVVGAKGSPLQLVLSAVYHVDAPTGNINFSAATKALTNPLVESYIPLAYGDSYLGYKIIGSTPQFIEKYGGVWAKGKLFQAPFEVVLGNQVAARSSLSVGNSFVGNHGESIHGQKHEGNPYRVVGILKETGTVLDQLVLTSLASVWQMHETSHSAPVIRPSHAPDLMSDPNHDQHLVIHPLQTPTNDASLEITAMLVKFRSPMGIMTMPRLINAGTTMQAAVPVLEINRLMHLMGIGISTLQGIGLCVMCIAGLSVFITLYNRLRERRYEQALLRSMGASRSMLLLLILSEGILISIVGFFLGIGLSRLGLFFLNNTAKESFHFQFSYQLIASEGWLFLFTLGIGMFAAFIPAVQAFRLNIANTLSDG